MKKETITVGLIAGRHNLPVDKYIFEEIQDVLDIKSIHCRISEFLETEVGITQDFGTCINQCDYTDVEGFWGQRHLVVYVTGLTVVATELVRMCALNGVSLTLMHYDRETGNYVEQAIF